MEELCYEEPCSCYSCKNTIENGNRIKCTCKKLCSFPLMYEDGDNNMIIDYRKAVIVAKNCTSYNEREIIHVALN